MTKIVAISDTHNLQHSISSVIPKCDIIIHSGDMTNVGKNWEFQVFADWFSSLPAKYKICIAGNHDFGAQKDPIYVQETLKNSGIIYLCDEAVILEGIKFYGSPWTPEFCNWAFQLYNEVDSIKVWSRIPDDTQYLITHGPMRGILDFTYYDKMNVGCPYLARRIQSLRELKVFQFGHIHETAGVSYIRNAHDKEVICINASVCNLRYDPINKPIVINWTKRGPKVKV